MHPGQRVTLQFTTPLDDQVGVRLSCVLVPNNFLANCATDTFEGFEVCARHTPPSPVSPFKRCHESRMPVERDDHRPPTSSHLPPRTAALSHLTIALEWFLLPRIWELLFAGCFLIYGQKRALSTRHTFQEGIDTLHLKSQPWPRVSSPWWMRALPPWLESYCLWCDRLSPV